MKHILLACFAAVVVIVLQSLTGIVPAAYQPFVAVAVAYFTHYYLETHRPSAGTEPQRTGERSVRNIFHIDFDNRHNFCRFEKSSSHSLEAVWPDRSAMQDQQ